MNLTHSIGPDVAHGCNDPCCPGISPKAMQLDQYQTNDRKPVPRNNGRKVIVFGQDDTTFPSRAGGANNIRHAFVELTSPRHVVAVRPKLPHYRARHVFINKDAQCHAASPREAPARDTAYSKAACTSGSEIVG
jgi:hypothetical protein